MELKEYERELRKYIRDKNKPSFNKFIDEKKSYIPKWSLDLSDSSDQTILQGIWWEKYKDAYINIKPKSSRPRKSKYNPTIWNDIIVALNRRRKLKNQITEDTIDIFTAASRPVAQEAASMFVDGSGFSSAQYGNRNFNRSSSSSNQHGESDSNRSNSSSNQHDEGSSGFTLSGTDSTNNKLEFFAMKKILGTITDQEEIDVDALVTRGDTIQDQLVNHSIRLIKKELLTDYEIELLKLMVSKTVNLIDDTLFSMMENTFSRGQWLYLEGPERHWPGMDLPTRALLDTIIDGCNDTDSMLIKIQEEKTRLIRDKERSSSTYHMLIILETAINYFDIKLRKDASETTFYKRFSMYVDFILTGSDINMCDGELVAEATRMEMQRNNHDITNASGRKIDLLLKLDEENVELCSNEWKSEITKYLKIRQQSKNIRTNCAILNSLHIMSKGSIKELMALDMIGSIGYVYLLKLKGGMFVASTVEPIFLPQEFSDLKEFKKTVDTLFAWRNFLDDLTQQVKASRKQMLLEGVAKKRGSADNVTLDDSCTELPSIFFTPKNQRLRNSSST